MRAAIYCRVSTDIQETEGTSLQTQLEACQKYCQAKGYTIAYQFSEVCSGLTLDRPKLNELRELVRAHDVDVVVIHCLDRLSRDPVHGVIVTEELEKHHIALEAVTESVDSTDLGKLITYVRGYASKIEAEKIRERCIRGKRARAREGRIPGGGGTTIYGYAYIKVAQKNGGRRIINKTEARWVRDMYSWLVNEGLSTNAITYRLRALSAPSKFGKMWNRHSVQAILINQAYTGKTYAFTTVRGRRQRTRPQSDWIEIEGVTPAIISHEVFDAAQKQLQVNRIKTVPTTKYEYLLRGHLRCRQCGRAYVGSTARRSLQNGTQYVKLYYRCMGKTKVDVPLERCCNKGWSAKRLDGMVWAEVERYLSNRGLIIGELEKQRQDADQLGVFEAELERVERQLKAIEGEQRQLLQWALKDFPANLVEGENKRLNKAKETLKAQKANLAAQLRTSQDALINVPNLERFIEDIQKRLSELDFEGKRLALDMLGITVWLDGENVEVTGIIDPEKQALRCPSNFSCTALALGKNIDAVCPHKQELCDMLAEDSGSSSRIWGRLDPNVARRALGVEPNKEI